VVNQILSELVIWANSITSEKRRRISVRISGRFQNGVRAFPSSGRREDRFQEGTDGGGERTI
jgi:hypothetical protein